MWLNRNGLISDEVITKPLKRTPKKRKQQKLNSTFHKDGVSYTT